MDSVSKILLIRPSALGDVCRTVPILVSLRRAFPDARIEWLVRDGFEPAIASHPDLDAPLTFPRDKMALPNWGKAHSRQTLRHFLGRLKSAHYDLAIDCQGLGRSGLFAWATRAPNRVGFADAREFGWLGLNQRYQLPKPMHTVDRMLGLIEAAGIQPVHDLRLYSDQAGQAFAQTAMPARAALFAPTSKWPGKQWPAQRFAELAQRLLAESDIDAVTIVGGPQERNQCAPLLELARSNTAIIDLVGRTDVGQLMALIERSALVIANDSAALHMAVGFDRPLIALFGPSRIDLVGPYRRDGDVIQPQPPDNQPLGPTSYKNQRLGAHMMRQITVDQVFDVALQRLIAGAGAAHLPKEQTLSSSLLKTNPA